MNLGRKQSDETKLKLRSLNLGKHLTEETKRKIRLSMQGKNSGVDNAMYGKIFSKQHRQRMSLSRLGMNLDDNNPMWKGDDVKYAGLHLWVRSRLVKPESCEICKINKPFDLANRTGVYNRDLINWQWLCRRCHMISDGRSKNWLNGSMKTL